jgi:hypothetical protein
LPAGENVGHVVCSEVDFKPPDVEIYAQDLAKAVAASTVYVEALCQGTGTGIASAKGSAIATAKAHAAAFIQGFIKVEKCGVTSCSAELSVFAKATESAIVTSVEEAWTEVCCPRISLRLTCHAQGNLHQEQGGTWELCATASCCTRILMMQNVQVSISQDGNDKGVGQAILKQKIEEKLIPVSVGLWASTQVYGWGVCLAEASVEATAGNTTSVCDTYAVSYVQNLAQNVIVEACMISSRLPVCCLWAQLRLLPNMSPATVRSFPFSECDWMHVCAAASAEAYACKAGSKGGYPSAFEAEAAVKAVATGTIRAVAHAISDAGAYCYSSGPGGEACALSRTAIKTVVEAWGSAWAEAWAVAESCDCKMEVDSTIAEDFARIIVDAASDVEVDACATGALTLLLLLLCRYLFNTSKPPLGLNMSAWLCTAAEGRQSVCCRVDTMALLADLI